MASIGLFQLVHKNYSPCFVHSRLCLQCHLNRIVSNTFPVKIYYRDTMKLRYDRTPSLRSDLLKQSIICLSAFLLGLCFTLRSGSYWLQVFDTFAGSVPLLVIAFFEVIAVTYVHGLQRFCKDIQQMTQRPVSYFWKVSWQIIAPIMMFTVFISYATLHKPSTYDAWNPNYEGFPAKESKLYPRWVVAICVMLSAVPCLLIPAGAAYQFGRTVLEKKQRQVLHPDTSNVNE